MMIVITGDKFNTTFGTMLIPTDQTLRVSVGDIIKYENNEYTVERIVPPTKPDGKWALEIK